MRKSKWQSTENSTFIVYIRINENLEVYLPKKKIWRSESVRCHIDRIIVAQQMLRLSTSYAASATILSHWATQTCSIRQHFTWQWIGTQKNLLMILCLSTNLTYSHLISAFLKVNCRTLTVISITYSESPAICPCNASCTCSSFHAWSIHHTEKIHGGSHQDGMVQLHFSFLKYAMHSVLMTTKAEAVSVYDHEIEQSHTFWMKEKYGAPPDALAVQCNTHHQLLFL